MDRLSRLSQGFLNPNYVRVRAAEDAPRGPFRVLERRHGLAEIVERGIVVAAEPQGNNHREPGYERVDALLADVEAAGSWARYAREPRKKMLVLAKLCEKGRATPPRRDRVLGALFDGGSRRGAASVVIPREVFWKVFEFWPCSH